jgi:hypothetical protein
MAEAQRGLFRQPAVGEDEAIAYVVSDRATMFITESEYRAEGIIPRVMGSDRYAPSGACRWM